MIITSAARVTGVIAIVTRNKEKSGNTGRLCRNLHIILLSPKHLELFLKNMPCFGRDQLLTGDFRAVQRLIWFKLLKNGTVTSRIIV